MSAALPDSPPQLGTRWRAEGHWADRTLIDEMGSAAGSFGEIPVVFHSQLRPSSATLAELNERAVRVAAALQRLGVGPGAAVAIQVPNWLEGAVAHAAAWLCGAVAVPIVPIYGPREVGFILRQSRALVFVTARQWRDRDCAGLLAGLGETPDLAHVVVIGESLAGTLAWADLEAASGSATAVTPSPDDPCLLVYTSGTTADPKGVRHSHNSLLADLGTMAQVRGGGPGAVQLAAFPSGHVAGVLGLLNVLVRATPSVLMDAWDPAAAARLVAEHRVTSSAGAPIYLSGLLDEAGRSGVDLSSLTDYMTGAANVSPALIERAERAGIAAYRCYGSSEHPTISTGRPDDPLGKRATTDGRLTPGNEVRIVTLEGRVADPEEDGEILVRGPEQFLGYLDPALNVGAYADGWLRTGDLGRMDADGYLTVTGRVKDIIVRGGEKISAAEVENVLLTHPAVAEAAVTGVPDQRYGERVGAFVVLRPGGSLTLGDIRALFTEAGLARQKTPEQLVLTDELPRTAAGKVRKSDLGSLLPGGPGA